MHDDTCNPGHLHARALTIWRSDTGGEDTDSKPYIAASTSSIGLALPAPAATAMARPLRWQKALLGYEAFTDAHGSTPRENSRVRGDVPEDERHLGEWGRYQRRHEARLTVFQRVRLDISPAFEWDILEAAWNVQADRIDAFHARYRRLPRLNVADPAELALARWLNRQLRQLQHRTLTDQRKARLLRLLAAV